jgi:SpoVK/Ycf46/Vps4 family AAA+-type ATPase
VLSELLVQLTGLEANDSDFKPSYSNVDKQSAATTANMGVSANAAMMRGGGKTLLKSPRLAAPQGSKLAGNSSHGIRNCSAETYNAVVPTRSSSLGKIVVLAATNSLSDVDPAFLRRFHARVFVDLPNTEDRVSC